jgi:hypothetical protein
MKRFRFIATLVVAVGMLLVSLLAYSQEDPCAKGHSVDTEKGLCTVCSTLTYAIGATGPGGGKIIYRSVVGFTVQAGPGFSAYLAHYLEAAPSGWKGGTNDPYLPWAPSIGEIPDVETLHISVIHDMVKYESRPPQAIPRSIGWGRKNTAIIVGQLSSKAPAAKACVDYRGSKNKSDWFFPSAGELYELYRQRGLSGMGLTDYYYLSSSQLDNEDHEGERGAVFVQDFSDGGQRWYSKDDESCVRPIRAF